MPSKSCKRSPSKNIFYSDIKPGTPIVDCGHVWVAGTGRNRALVYWDGQHARAAQTRLKAAAKRGRW